MMIPVNERSGVNVDALQPLQDGSEVWCEVEKTTGDVHL